MNSEDRKKAAKILSKLSELPIFEDSDNYIIKPSVAIKAMEEYAQQRIKDLAPTDEEILQEADKYCKVDDEDEPGEKRNNMEAFEYFSDGMFKMREKLTGTNKDGAEEKQKEEISKEVRRITSQKDDGCHNCSVKDCRIYSSGKKCGNYHGYPKGAPFDEEKTMNAEPIITTTSNRVSGCWDCGNRECSNFCSDISSVCSKWMQLEGF